MTYSICQTGEEQQEEEEGGGAGLSSVMMKSINKDRRGEDVPHVTCERPGRLCVFCSTGPVESSR